MQRNDVCPGNSISPIADMDVHRTIVPAVLAAKSSAETPKKLAGRPPRSSKIRPRGWIGDFEPLCSQKRQALEHPAACQARTRSGIETQRQWNDLAIGRTTPALFGLYSLVTRLAHGLLQADARVVSTTAWYVKPRPTFADAIAVVRRELWSACYFARSGSCTETIKIPRSVFERLTDTLCYAA